MFIITAGAIAGIPLLFSLILAIVCWHFKKQIRSNRSPESSPHKHNGDVNLETSRLTATEANEQEV
ncbi:hypothetical protein LSH36_485g01001 [Paralvinella palmiformis]|uniref:Uncharacterized protein n=1 Tax=Paralvinella palmiformis TaxID=53620 RepID=A0AAD9J939_9ANNE|nr:hypothetical protein LSH36_485g01001 [Paralvinella palmiformis]